MLDAKNGALGASPKKMASAVRVANLKELAVITDFPKRIPDVLTEDECKALRDEVQIHQSHRVIARYLQQKQRNQRIGNHADWFFYVIQLQGTHYKTGITQDVKRRLQNYATANPHARVAAAWPCRNGLQQEKSAQDCMKNHPSCQWVGGETFTVFDEQAFLGALSRLFAEVRPPSGSVQDRTGQQLVNTELSPLQDFLYELGYFVRWIWGKLTQ